MLELTGVFYYINEIRQMCDAIEKQQGVEDKIRMFENIAAMAEKAMKQGKTWLPKQEKK